MIRTLLAAALLIVPAAAHADWYEASTDHFVVYSEENPERLEKFATQLERFDKALRMMRGLASEPVGDANRVVVYVVDGTSTVSRLARDSNVAGFYHARAGGSMAVVPRQAGFDSLDLSSQAILLHEYTHHLMLSLWPHAHFQAGSSRAMPSFTRPHGSRRTAASRSDCRPNIAAMACSPEMRSRPKSS